jgi:hypothetical protein
MYVFFIMLEIVGVWLCRTLGNNAHPFSSQDKSIAHGSATAILDRSVGLVPVFVSGLKPRPPSGAGGCGLGRSYQGELILGLG